MNLPAAFTYSLIYLAGAFSFVFCFGYIIPVFASQRRRRALNSLSDEGVQRTSTTQDSPCTSVIVDPMYSSTETDKFQRNRLETQILTSSETVQNVNDKDGTETPPVREMSGDEEQSELETDKFKRRPPHYVT